MAALVRELGVAVHDQHIAGDAMYDDTTGAVRLDGNPIDVASFRFAAGADSLTSGLAERLRSSGGSDPRTGSHVHSVDVGADGVRVRFDADPATSASSSRDDGGRPESALVELDADHVIIAVPPALAVSAIRFRPDIASELRSVAERTPVWMGAVSKVVARYESAFWREAGLSGSAVSHRGPMNEIHDLSGPGGRPAALFGFARTSVSSGPVDETHLLDQLVRLFGPFAASPLELTVADWRTETFTSPQDVELMIDHSTFGHRVFQQPALGGRVHWASTETSPESAGHIEGALAAAERAVAHIVESCDDTADRPQPIGSAT